MVESPAVRDGAAGLAEVLQLVSPGSQVRAAAVHQDQRRAASAPFHIGQAGAVDVGVPCVGKRVVLCRRGAPPRATASAVAARRMPLSLQSADGSLRGPPTASRSARTGCPSSRSTCGGAGTSRHATSSGPSTTRSGERPRTTRSGCCGRSRRRPLNGRPPIRPFRRRTTSPSATWTRPGAPGTRGGPARFPISTAAPSPTSRLNSPCISRCPSTLAGLACWRATTARRHRTLACRSSASGSCTRRATSTSTSRPKAGRRKATRS